MSINIGIIDQRVKKLAEQYQVDIQQQLNTTKAEPSFLISTAFVLLCIHTVLDISLEEALSCLTEGGNDAGIDGLHCEPPQDGEFIVTIFQGKYKQKLEGSSHFPENAIIKLIGSIQALFDPDKPLILNPQLQSKVEYIRSLIRDSYIPTVRVMLCNNGLAWNEIAQQYIEATTFGNQVKWIHINHDQLVELLQKNKPINIHLQLVDKAIIDDETYDYQRILIGKVPVVAIKNLFDEHGDRLLEHNIRRYLGLHKNWVNQNIRQCLLDDQNRQNFYFYNNGITMVCSQFRHSRLQDKNWKLQIKNAQIINGGQTCLTIKETLESLGGLFDEFSFQNTYVLLRLYELMEEDNTLIRNITYATNSQTPIHLRELKANDDIQQKLALAVKDLGYQYKRKRDTSNGDSSTISLQLAARAILAIWRRKPQVVRAFREEQFFSQFYEEIFHDKLNATQLITAVLILRMIESERKHRMFDDNAPRFLPYASYFLAMLTGELLLERLNISLAELDHRYFVPAKTTLEHSRHDLYQSAINRLEKAIQKLHSDYQTMSLQRLSATFRRGDLLEFLLGAKPDLF
jgi:hypothetical protein